MSCPDLIFIELTSKNKIPEMFKIDQIQVFS